MIKTFFFDFGRVLVNFDHDIIINKIAKISDKSKDKIRNVILKPKALIGIDLGTITEKTIYNNMEKELNTGLTYDEFIPIWNSIFEIKQDMIDFLYHIKEKYEIIMLSNISPLHRDFLFNTYPEVKVFNSYVLSCDIGERKPDKEIYEIALTKTKSQPEECIFIDDMKENADGAKELGINGIQFSTLNTLKTELKAYNINI